MLKVSLGIAYFYVLVMGIIFWGLGFYENSTFFNFGCSKDSPIYFFNKKIESMTDFWFLQIMIFFHQLINNLLNTVVYPWIINVVQNKNCLVIEESKKTTLFIVNLFDLYSEIDLVLILVGFTSQISFVIIICLANLITTTITTKKYLKNKNRLEGENVVEDGDDISPSSLSFQNTNVLNENILNGNVSHIPPPFYTEEMV